MTGDRISKEPRGVCQGKKGYLSIIVRVVSESYVHCMSHEVGKS